MLLASTGADPEPWLSKVLIWNRILVAQIVICMAEDNRLQRVWTAPAAHILAHCKWQWKWRNQAPSIGKPMIEISTPISTTCIRLWFTFRLKSLQIIMKCLSNSNGRIPALKKWEFTIDVGTPMFYVLYPPLIFSFSLLPIYFINHSNIYQSPLIVSKPVDKQRCPFWPGKLNVKVWSQVKVKVTKKWSCCMNMSLWDKQIGPDYIAVAWI